MSWIPITKAEYCSLASADHQVISTNVIQNINNLPTIEVVMGIEDEPILKHQITAAFEIYCWKWENPYVDH